MEPDEPSAEKVAACGYLESLLNKNLRIYTTDGRMFRGDFKCTDPVGLTVARRGVRDCRR